MFKVSIPKSTLDYPLLTMHFITIESSWNLHKNSLNKIHKYKNIMHLILLYFNAYTTHAIIFQNHGGARFHVNQYNSCSFDDNCTLKPLSPTHSNYLFEGYPSKN